MSIYTQNIEAIRKARKLRDEEDDKLYALKLRLSDLLNEKKKFASGEIVVDREQRRKLIALREELAGHQKKLRAAEDELNQLFKLSELLQDKFSQTQAVQDQIEIVNAQIAVIEAELSSQITDEQRKNLIQQKDELETKLSRLKERLEKLRDETEGIENRIGSSNRGELETKRERESEEIKRVRTQIEETIRSSGTIENPDDRIRDIKEQITNQRDVLNQNLGLAGNLIGRLFDNRTPQQLIEEWNDQLPILLLPLRLETKFKIEGRLKELWVRVFPDEIAVNTHEEVLTTQEVEYGETYWKALQAAADDAAKKEAWSMMANKFGGNRSAWIAIQTKPTNWDDDVAAADQLQFPAHDLTKSSQWTKAPHTHVLPDKFILLCYRKNKLVNTQIGRQIDDMVILGPAPLGEDGETPSISQDETNGNRIELGADFEWVAKFETAVNKGLGFKVNLAEDAPDGIAQGYDQLLVIGLKLSADETDAQELVEKLIHNHHFSKNGFSLIKQGTPTNNTEEKDAGFTKSDPLNEESYFVETGKPLFDPATAKRDALTDGQRLSEFLGINYEPLQYIANSDAREHTEASAMNSALYASTLGYFMNSMMNDVVSDDALRQLRYHFKKYVTGRGALPAIRVGNQPYGILLTSSFPKWKYSSIEIRNNGFLNNLYNIQVYIEAQWRQILPELAQISKTGDAGKNLMEILGLHPTSVEFFQRVGYSFDSLNNMAEFGWEGKYSDDRWKMVIEGMLASLMLRQLGYKSTFDDNTAKPVPLFLQLIFQHYTTELEKKNLIDGLPLSEENKIKYYDEAQEKHYIHWLIENAGNAEKLRKKDFGTVAAPNTLLFMLLLNSLLLESSNSIFNFLKTHNIAAKELVRSVKFRNISSTPSISPWEVFHAPVNQVVGNVAVNKSFYEYVHTVEFNSPASSHFAGDLLDQKEALDILKDMSTASLERVMVEHLDILTYRLDAWQTSLFTRRMEEQRNIVESAAQRRKGIYLGSYGYLENVKPGNRLRIKVNEDILPEVLRENKDNLYVELGNGGYIHAPSLNHATAAALLRNGYLSHATAEQKDMLAVNLSSERTRRALYLIEGIRNGQTLEVLLGYQFERGLHEWTTKQTNPVFLNHLIPAFRQKYPVKKTKVPQAGNVTGPEEITDDFHVVNGLTLAQTTNSAPYINESLTTAQTNAIVREKDNIQNTLDALRDVLTAESAYQLAMGNFERAAAVVRAMADGALPPDIEVIKTARGTNLSLTNRVIIHFDSSITSAPPDWTTIPMTLRAEVEPGLNHWVGTSLGNPDKIRCRVKAVDAEGNVLKNGGMDIAGIVTLKQLLIQPIDFMYLIRNKTEESGTSELETRIRYVFAQREILNDNIIIKIEFLNNGENPAAADMTVKSFAEILPFADSMRNIVSGSRPVHARDYEPASKELVAPADNPENLNVTDLQTRVEYIYSQINPMFTALKDAWEDAALLQTETSVNDLRSAVKAIADAGFVLAFPYSAVGFGQPEMDSLFGQAESLVKRFDEIKEKYAQVLLQVNDASTKVREKVSLLISFSKILINDDYVIVPRFHFTNTDDVTNSYVARAQLLAHSVAARGNPLVMDEWLHSISTVRPKMHTFEMMRVFHDGLSDDLMECEPLQLPYRENDSWLAVEYPEGTTIEHDTLSFALYAPQGFDGTKEQCGLIIDDWVEIVPQREEVTGLTFNFNQPNSVPPQAILMAVTPQIQGSWKWDDLVETIRDTFHRAKLRAVEPDQLDTSISMMNKFLPAVISEFSTGKNNISLDLALILPVLALQISGFYTQEP
jgi:hypothetical protein